MSDWPDLKDYTMPALLAALQGLVAQQGTTRDPVVAQALALRAYDVRQRIAEINANEVARRDAVRAAALGAEPTVAPIDDALLSEIAHEAALASSLDRASHPNGLSDQDVNRRTTARIACVVSVPALLTEIMRLKLEIMSHDDLADALLRTASAQMEALSERVRVLEDDLRAAREPTRGGQ